MALPKEHVKSYLSCAYVQAVAAHAGAAITNIPQDYGDDVHIQYIRKVGSKFEAIGVILHCQIKATTTCFFEGSDVVYDIDAKAYNKLVRWEGSPIILIIFRMPDCADEWLELSEDQLLMKNCCYWSHINGSPSSNQKSVRIRVPRTQVFNSKTVKSLLEDIRNYGKIR